MDQTASNRAALMSIRPRFASAILDGSKRIEFRKRRLAPDINVGVTYATAPVQAVVDEISISGQVSASPEELWSRFAGIGGIDAESFFTYFEGHRQAIGILIDEVTDYEEPQPLDVVDPGGRPPQSVKYLPSPV